MYIRFRCTNCGELLSVRFLAPGEKAHCKSCLTMVVVPPESESLPDDTPATVQFRPYEQKENIYRLLAAAPLALPPPPGAPFARALKVTTIAIVITQALGILLWASTGFSIETPSDLQATLGNIADIVLYLIVAGVVITDMAKYGLVPARVFDLQWSALSRQPRLLLGCMAGVGLAVTGLWLILGLEDLGDAGRPAFVQALSFFVVVVVAPICEEILFRGYLYTSMKQIMRTDRERQIVNATLFAAAHVFLPMFLLGATVPYYIFALGFLLAYLYDRTGSLMPSIILHAFNNCLVFFMSQMQ